MICKICNKEFKSPTALTNHLRYHLPEKMDSKTYYLKYLGEVGYCPICGKECKFRGLMIGFTTTCCDKKCLAKFTSISNGGKKRSNKVKKKLSLRMLKWHKDNPEKSTKLAEKMRHGITEESRKKAGDSISKTFKENPEILALKRLHSPKSREKQAKTMRNKFNKLRTESPSEKNYYLYIMSNNEGLIKIGVSGNPKKRAKQLEKTYQKDISIIDTYYGNFNKVHNLETKMHYKFDGYNVVLPKGGGRTEWFKVEALKEILEMLDFYRGIGYGQSIF